MKFVALRVFLLAGLCAGTGGGAWAQDRAYLGKREDIGKKEYGTHCAICHGIDGKGHGAYKGFLKVAPADLTTIAKKNNGVFPVDRIYKVIDGREAIETHGPREMPIWGTELSIRAPGNRMDRPNDADEEDYARSRILAIIDYLFLLQEK
jgi:mono/diheme cytochrome c family protein